MGLKSTGKIMIVGTIIFFMVPFVLAQPPQATLSNGVIKAKVYLPDNEKGYYRSTRFDWAGLVADLQYNGHSYFGQWFKNYDPMVHESVMGPMDEFSPLGYEEANVGESFVKIGVGALTKPQQPSYTPFIPYDIIDPGTRKTKVEKDRVIFVHVFESEGYSYEYTKTLWLPLDEPKMILRHVLKNTGNKTMDSQVYNHNFFVLDGQDVGPGYQIRFPFDIEGSGTTGLGEFALIKGAVIEFIKNLGEGHHVQLRDIKGYGDSASDYDITVENSVTGVGAKITCNRPLSRLAFWSASKTVCPEPYVHVKVEPGAVFYWDITYEFYSLKTDTD